MTQERVEKLLRQIGDKELEIDELQKLSPKDIWTADLDAFVEEWNNQHDEEAKRKKKIASMGRRASHKLGIGASKGGKGKKKRKFDETESDDSGSDFGPVKKKTKPKKEGLLGYLMDDTKPAKKPSAAEALKSSKAFDSTSSLKQGTLLAHLPKKESIPQTDGPSESRSSTADPAPAVKQGRPAAAKVVKKPTPAIDSEDEDSDVFALVAKEAEKKPTTSRTARGATKQAPKYKLGGSDSDSESDDLLGDVSSMVKTIGAGTGGAPMFKTSSSARPGSNGNIRPGSAAGGPKAAKKNTPIEPDDDETNYEGLMPQPSPQRPAPRNVNDTIMGSDDEDFGPVIKKSAASKITTKPAPKLKAATTKAAPKPKATGALAAVKKTTTLSPAAKAYAAKQAKAKKPVTVDSEDETMEDADALADEILSDDGDEPAPKPAARAAAARPGRTGCS